MTDLTEQQLEKLAVSAAQKTVMEMCEKFGLDVSDARSSQMDFAHLRKQRLASEQVGKLAMRSIVTLAVTGFFSTLWLGLTTYFKP